jgi:signal transduction histidine kinase
MRQACRSNEGKRNLSRRRNDRCWYRSWTNGQGFEPARISVLNLKRGGFGLLSMRERLALLGGNLDIDSAPGQGTKITITLPIDTCGQP